jgi:hypothetical protein
MQTEYTPTEGVIFIFGLTDPYTGRIRYVGCSHDFDERVRRLTEIAATTKKRGGVYPWLRQLFHRGLGPNIKILETCTPAEMRERHKHWIKEIAKTEPRLLNVASNDQFVRPRGHMKQVRVIRDVPEDFWPIPKSQSES